MKYFLETIECARTRGIDAAGFEEGEKEPVYIKAQKGDLPYDLFWDNVKECRPFVFLGSEKEPIYNLDVNRPIIKIDRPFKVFSLERTSGPLIGQTLNNGMFGGWIVCCVAIEYDPEIVHFYNLIYFEDGRRMVIFSRGGSEHVQKYLDRLSAQLCGTEDVRVRFKSGSGKDKKTSTIRRIVYVKPKRFTEKDPTEGREIDWSHRWQVRGHWRTIQGLGKDRDGDYKVHNHTWVTDHERGPEDAPLVKKTRVVKGDQNGVQVQR